MRVGVISDTHIPLRARCLPPLVFDIFHGVDHIIHAGDLTSLNVISDLESLAPVTAVAGNTDSFQVYSMLGEKKVISLAGFNIGVYHGHGYGGSAAEKALNKFADERLDCIIFGHSHSPCSMYHGNILLFNPGSPTDKRGNMYFSVGILDLNEKIIPEIVYFTPGKIIKRINFIK